MRKKVVAIVLAALMAAGLMLTGCSGSQNEAQQPGSAGIEFGLEEQSALDAVCAYLQETVPQPVYSQVGGEWTVFSLVRAGIILPDETLGQYLVSVDQVLTDHNGVLDERRFTEYSRVILALTALGEDVTDVAGYNLLERLSDYPGVTKQGLGGPIWALIAMDSAEYEFVEDMDGSRASYVEFILQRQLETGGWGYFADELDPDITSMAIVALHPYASDNQEVQAAIDDALTALSNFQTQDGAFQVGDVAAAEVCAQVVTALSTIGIDADTDERFVKDGISVYDALLSYQLSDGSFCHIKGDESDLIATEQACYALVAYERFLNGEATLFDLTGVE